jgi:hypothetical protein
MPRIPHAPTVVSSNRVKRVFTALLGASASFALLAANSPPPDIVARARAAFGIAAGPIAVSAPFAVANFTGLQLEGSRIRGQALFRKYAFGWQMLDLTEGSFRACDLRGEGVPASSLATRAVNDGGLPPNTREPCPSPHRFAEPTADEVAVRAVIPGTPLQWFETVDIADGYALISWAGGGGGPMIARKRSGHWKIYHGAGGAPSACWLVQFGDVPPATAHRLMVEDVGNAPAAQWATQADHCPPLR